MTEPVIEAIEVAKILGSGAAQVQALKGVSLVRQWQNHAVVDTRVHADADNWDGSRPGPLDQRRESGGAGQA